MNEEIKTSKDVLKDYSLLKKIDRFFYFFIKRLFDIVFSLLEIMFLLPISLIVKISYVLSGDYKTIFYKQKRIGKNGKIIYIFKYRTMIPDADKVLKELLKKPKYKKEWKSHHKLSNDPRITKVGRILRKSSLDEFPQFINVLIGDMALIGNRPYLPREKKEMGKYFNNIVSVKCGIISYWAVMGHSDVSFKTRLKLEQYYSKNQSLKLDVKIFLRTFRVVLLRKGAK